MTRLLVTGSRNWVDADAMYPHLSRLAVKWSATRPDDGVVLVHGDAPGADSVARDLADETTGPLEHWTTEAHPADWDTHGKGAGPIRNQAMVDLGADLCLAFPLRGSRGTWDCVKRANEAGIPVWIPGRPT